MYDIEFKTRTGSFLGIDRLSKIYSRDYSTATNKAILVSKKDLIKIQCFFEFEGYVSNLTRS